MGCGTPSYPHEISSTLHRAHTPTACQHSQGTGDAGLIKPGQEMEAGKGRILQRQPRELEGSDSRLCSGMKGDGRMKPCFSSAPGWLIP